jgi:HPt (histidine-containing phosphotransfer) domain-containing protein
VDLSVLENLRTLQEPGEPDAVVELAELFLRDAPARVEAIKLALAAGLSTPLREAAHTLKGSANNLGARRLADICGRIETASRQDRPDDANAAAALLDEEFARVRFLLEQEAKKQNSAQQNEHG